MPRDRVRHQGPESPVTADLVKRGQIKDLRRGNRPAFLAAIEADPDEDTLKTYLREIGAIPLLNQSGEWDLMRRRGTWEYAQTLGDPLGGDNTPRGSAGIFRRAYERLPIISDFITVVIPNHERTTENAVMRSLGSVGMIVILNEETLNRFSQRGQTPDAQQIREAAAVFRFLPTEMLRGYAPALLASPKPITFDHEAFLGNAETQEALHEKLVDLREDARAANQKLLESNLRLVVSIAKHFTGRGMSLKDLIQEGNLGLITAAEKFDYHRGYKFSTYITWWIRQAVSRGLGEYGSEVRLPIHMGELTRKLNRVATDMFQLLEREPTPIELGEATGLTPEQVREVQAAAVTSSPVSLELSVNNKRGNAEVEVKDLIADGDLLPEEEALASDRTEQVGNALGALNERERRVIELRFGIGDGEKRTLSEVAYKLGGKITRERVRQIEAKALTKLRRPAVSWKLKVFVNQ